MIVPTDTVSDDIAPDITSQSPTEQTSLSHLGKMVRNTVIGALLCVAPTLFPDTAAAQNLSQCIPTSAPAAVRSENEQTRSVPPQQTTEKNTPQQPPFMTGVVMGEYDATRDFSRIVGRVNFNTHQKIFLVAFFHPQTAKAPNFGGYAGIRLPISTNGEIAVGAGARKIGDRESPMVGVQYTDTYSCGHLDLSGFAWYERDNINGNFSRGFLAWQNKTGHAAFLRSIGVTALKLGDKDTLKAGVQGTFRIPGTGLDVTPAIVVDTDGKANVRVSAAKRF